MLENMSFVDQYYQYLFSILSNKESIDVDVRKH